MRSVMKRLRMSHLCEELERSMPGLGEKVKRPRGGKGLSIFEKQK